MVESTIMKIKDALSPTDWTEQIPQPNTPDWRMHQSKIPVVKVSSHPDGHSILYAITTPVITRVEGDKESLVTSLLFEVSGRFGRGSMENIPIEELKTGKIKWPGGLTAQVEFDGLAGSQKHWSRQWSWPIEG